MEGTRRSHNGQPELLTRLVSTDGTNHNANCGLSAGAGQRPRRPVSGGAARRSDPEPCCFSQAASALSSRAGPPGAVTAPGDLVVPPAQLHFLMVEGLRLAEAALKGANHTKDWRKSFEKLHQFNLRDFHLSCNPQGLAGALPVFQKTYPELIVERA